MHVTPRLLIIGSVWPEPTASAAGTRMMQLINLVEVSYQVHFASTAEINIHQQEHLPHVSCHSIQLNSDSFQEFIQQLQPSVVIYDRFMTEEQFSWRVREVDSKIIHVLDTEDLHSLRAFRKLNFNPNELNSDFSYDRMIELDLTRRELASIYRCDLSLIISDFEINLLKRQFQIPDYQLFYLPIFLTSQQVNQSDLPIHFFSVGNFKHAPNLTACRLLISKIWPELKQRLPKANLFLYGAYSTQEVNQWHKPKEGVFVKGNEADLSNIFNSQGILLAPLQFGAGIKGKILDAIQFKVPFITSKIGLEGIPIERNKTLASSISDFILKAEEMYVNFNEFEKVEFPNLSSWDFDYKQEELLLQLVDFHSNIERFRRRNIVGNLMANEHVKATKYLSKWISAKNQGK